MLPRPMPPPGGFRSLSLDDRSDCHRRKGQLPDSISAGRETVPLHGVPQYAIGCRLSVRGCLVRLTIHIAHGPTPVPEPL